jgi:hypothetical protein
MNPIPDLLSDLFTQELVYPRGVNAYMNDTFLLIYNFLGWDIVKGSLAFTLGLGIALFAVQRIREAFNGG